MFGHNDIYRAIITTIAIEFPHKLSRSDLESERSSMIASFGLDYHALHDNIMRIARINLKSIINAIDKIKPMTIDIEMWRSEAAKPRNLYISHKPDGYNGICFFSLSHGALFVSRGAIYVSSPTTNSGGPEYVTRTDSYQIARRIIDFTNYVIHGEMINDTFVAFAVITANLTMPTWASAIRQHGIIDDLKKKVSGIKIIMKEYVGIGESLQEVDYPTDGIVIVNDTGASYANTQPIKIKPLERNTADLMYKNGTLQAIFPKTGSYVPARCPLITPNIPLGNCNIGNTSIPLSDNVVYESRYYPDGTFTPVNIRTDKVSANSMRAVIASMSSAYIGDWMDIVKRGDIIGFSSTHATSAIRFELSKIVHAAIDEFLNQTGAKCVLDIGGGKLGYFKKIHGNARIQRYLNIDADMIELWGGVLRLCQAATQEQVQFFQRYYIFAGEMQKPSTRLALPRAWMHTFDTVISVFALNHGAETLDDLRNTIQLIADLSAGIVNILFVFYDYDRLLHELESCDEIDLVITKFAKTTDKNKIKVTPQFAGGRAFIEPVLRLELLIDEMRKHEFNLSLSSHFNIGEYIDEKTKESMPMTVCGYINIVNFVRVNTSIDRKKKNEIKPDIL